MPIVNMKKNSNAIIIKNLTFNENSSMNKVSFKIKKRLINIVTKVVMDVILSFWVFGSFCFEYIYVLINSDITLNAIVK